MDVMAFLNVGITAPGNLDNSTVKASLDYKAFDEKITELSLNTIVFYWCIAFGYFWWKPKKFECSDKFETFLIA